MNCYEFAYSARDTINDAAKNATGVMKATTIDMNNIAKQRINQIISQGRNEVEHLLPKIIRGAIEDVYETPFRLLGNFGKQKLNKLKKKILNSYTSIFYNYLYIRLNNN